MNSITPSVSDNTKCYDWNKIQKRSSIFLFDVIMAYMFIRLIDKEVPVICVLLICNIGVVWIMFDTVPLLYTSCLWCFDCKPDRSHENTFNVFIRITLIHREDIGPIICRAVLPVTPTGIIEFCCCFSIHGILPCVYEEWNDAWSHDITCVSNRMPSKIWYEVMNPFQTSIVQSLPFENG